MRTHAIQRYSLLAAYIGAPIFMLASVGHEARPTFLVWSGTLYLGIFCCSVTATLLTGVAYGKGFEPFDRRKRPGFFWLLVALQIVLCGILIYAIMHGLAGLRRA